MVGFSGFQRVSIIAGALMLGSAGAAQAQSCTLVLDAQTGHTRMEEGHCDTRYTPASTFKVPLALMGYDAGVLTDAHNPRWDGQKEQRAPQRDRKSVDPTIWEADSVVWYSRELLRQLGAERFNTYVKQFHYGNEDVSGDPGADNALTKSWISSSLQISPREQAAFLRRLLAQDLPVSREAQRQTMEIIPHFQTKSGWNVQGKTGSGTMPADAPPEQAGKPVGWFVGWANRNGETIIFARQNIGTAQGRQGLVERETLLSLLEKL